MTPEPPKGFIKLARKAFAAEGGDALWLEEREFSRFEAWLDVLQLAAWKPWRYVTQHGPIDLQRGEFVASLRYLADRWTWSVKKVRTWLTTLEKWARLRAQQKTEAGTVYLIVNYDRYQSDDSTEDTAKGTPSGTPRAQQGHKREAVKAVDGKSIKAVESTGAVAPPLRLVAHSWPAEGAAAWVEFVGRMSEGKFGKLMKPFVDVHGWPAVRVAMVRWIMDRQATNQLVKLEWFADVATAEIHRPAQPLVDEYGCLTAYGDRITRPVKHA